jgi:hypothetical protein
MYSFFYIIYNIRYRKYNSSLVVKKKKNITSVFKLLSLWKYRGWRHAASFYIPLSYSVCVVGGFMYRVGAGIGHMRY